ncbi:MAG: peptidylprolyl isomerase [Gemmatimonadaceae bacterium]|nr:peptidylprolyl isomerase [Gemmatimonadaceae bacterium]MCW5827424.1 peptidylprolyl isomerase [Gemmatimonadaceae bacterium]
MPRPSVRPARFARLARLAQPAGLSALAVATVIALPASTIAQVPAPPLSAADSALVYRVLVAEDRRDGAAPALTEGAAHRDERIRRIAERARARIADSTFAQRDLLGAPSGRPLPVWPEPEWAGRLRQLGGAAGDCAPVIAAFTDSAVHVRLRAFVVVRQRTSCHSDTEVRRHLASTVDALPASTESRRVPAASWHEAAEALVSLARIAPTDAAGHITRAAAHAQPQLRIAAAQAAALARDTVTLLRLARDPDNNVSEAAIAGLSRTVGHAADSVYLSRLGTSAAQVSLAAATALRGSTHPELAARAQAALQSYERRSWASERDVRNALRTLLGQPAREPWQPWKDEPLPQDVVALALGAERYIEVTMSRRHGGRSFVVELRGDVAPIMAARVLAKVRAGGYNGTRWHRVESNFVIQGGGPDDNEYVGGGRFLVDELGTIAHPRGSVGMSTRGHDTGDTQWFINLRDNARLMGAYTVFGVVVTGMDVVDDVLAGDEMYVLREVSAPARRGPP